MKSLSILLLLSFSMLLSAAEPRRLTDAILFRATFDHTADADTAKGDARIYTAESLERKEPKAGLLTDAVILQATGGRTGGALRFIRQTKQLVFFKAGKNLPYRREQFAGSISMWMKLDPKQDLPKGYVDPLQITDKKWNDAAFFVDFDQAEERDFRLGVFSDFTFWNSKNRKFDDIPQAERPMVTVKNPPFASDKWTHVLFTWHHFNDAEKNGEAILFIDGQMQGRLRGPQRFTWDPEKAVIMIGINYIGLIDDVTIFDRAINRRSPSIEVRQLIKS